MRSLVCLSLVSFVVMASAACNSGRRGGSRSPLVDGAVNTDGSIRSDATFDASTKGCFSTPVTAETNLVIDIEQSCAIWNSLDAMNGEATITQVGQVLSIDFGSGIRFEGTRTGDQVSLAYDHEHPFSDGCQWRASEALSGSIDSVSCSLNFRYAYDEQPISAPPCATPCSARANVDVMFTIIR